VVTECAQGGAASTAIGNLGGANDARPSTSLPGSDALRQRANAGRDSNGDDPNGSPNSNSGQGGTSGGNDPQDSGPDSRDLNEILLEFRTAGGPLQHWGTQGAIRTEELVQFSGA